MLTSIYTISKYNLVCDKLVIENMLKHVYMFLYKRYHVIA